MTADERALVQAIIASPDDDLPRLVYADWLEEHGRPERAEHIRVQCELARLVFGSPDSDRRYDELTGRIRDLNERHLRSWDEEYLSRFPKNLQLRFLFNRGMPDEMGCTVKYFDQHGGTVLDELPIRVVRFAALVPKHARLLALCPATSRIREVRFGDDVSPEAVHEILARWPFRGADALSFHAYLIDGTTNEWHDRWASRARALANSEHLAQLRYLSLYGCGVGDEGGLALADSPHLRNLGILDLRMNPLRESSRREVRQRFSGRVLFDTHDQDGLTCGDLR